jgi:purine-binding chemotaxis protein CheW
MQISTFTIGEELYGIDILLIKEIGHLQEVTPIPGALPYNYGLMNLRGRVISIIHPMLFVNYSNEVSLVKNRIVIFKTDDFLN